MTFVWPGLLLLLLLVPMTAGVYVWALRRRRTRGVRYSSLSLVHAARPGPARRRRHLPFVLFAAALAALAFAVGRPVAIAAVPANQTTIVLVMDVSGSMCSDDIAPTRLIAAENAAAAFIAHQGPSTQIGIVAFSGFAQIVQTPTNDTAALISALRSLTTGRRTALGSGILAAIDAIAEVDPAIQPSTGEDRPGVEPPPVTPGAYAPDIIVALTDGASNFGPEPADAARQAATRGLRVYTIGFGTPGGGELEPTCASQFRGREPGGGGTGFGGGGFGGGGGVPARHRRSGTHGRRRPDRRDVLPGRQCRPAGRRLREPADEPDPEARGRRARRGVRGAWPPAGRWRPAPRTRLAPAALIAIHR